jgi:WD40 repeat protein
MCFPKSLSAHLGRRVASHAVDHDTGTRPPGKPSKPSNTMDFTEIYKLSSSSAGASATPLAAYSPSGNLLATAVQYRLVIRDAESLQILHLFTASDTIQAVEWSADGQLVLAASLKLGIIHAWSVTDPEWTAKLDEGWVGLVRAAFTPDARHLMCWSDFSVCIAWV